MSDDCMSRRIRHHNEHADRHTGGHDQIVAIAASERGVARDSHAAMDCAQMECHERQPEAVGSFGAVPAIQIKGGNYRATETGDGYFTVHDVPFVSEWKKGDHGAPYDGTKEVLQEFVDTAQARYNDGHFCATAYKRHNPDIPITHPDFMGFALPRYVGKYSLEDGERWTIFGDVKIGADKFTEARAGKIPYVSVEIPWAQRRIRGLSFQDTLPPQYEYALFTIGEVSRDETAKFAAIPEVAAMPEPKTSEIEAAVAKFAAEVLPKIVEEAVGKAMAEKPGEKKPVEGEKPEGEGKNPHDSSAGKPSQAPAQMSMDAETAAKFAAIVNDNAEIKAKFFAMENEKKAAALVAEAEKRLAAKSITRDLMEQIGSFAAEAVSKKDCKAWFEKMVTALSTSLREKPPSDYADFVAGSTPSSQDPAVAKFAQEGPEVMAEVARFAAQHRALRKQFGDRYSCPEDKFVEMELARWKDERNGHGAPPSN